MGSEYADYSLLVGKLRHVNAHQKTPKRSSRGQPNAEVLRPNPAPLRVVVYGEQGGTGTLALVSHGSIPLPPCPEPQPKRSVTTIGPCFVDQKHLVKSSAEPQRRSTYLPWSQICRSGIKIEIKAFMKGVSRGQLRVVPPRGTNEQTHQNLKKFFEGMVKSNVCPELI